MVEPEKCPLCGCKSSPHSVSDENYDGRCKPHGCSQAEYRAALRGHHSRDPEVEALKAEIENLRRRLRLERRNSALEG